MKYLLVFLVLSFGCAKKPYCYISQDRKNLIVENDQRYIDLKKKADYLQELVWKLTPALEKCQGVEESKYDEGISENTIKALEEGFKNGK